jgi:3-hydroxybutyryl-CoA dehydratase
VKQLYLEDLTVGMSAQSDHVVDDASVQKFAEVCGDFNPLHMDEEYAKTTIFGGRIAHGALSASYLSAVLGNQLPGPGAVFLEMDMRFRRPVPVGSTVTAYVEVAEINESTGRVRMACKCLVGGKTVVQGETLVKVNRRPAE